MSGKVEWRGGVGRWSREVGVSEWEGGVERWSREVGRE